MADLNDFSGSIDRNIDIVFCIDGTGSMGKLIDDVKNNAKKFSSDLTDALLESNTNITSLRVKVITFRDYKYDDDAMEITPFFELPSDQADFEKAVDCIEAHGGGDNDENGLEALYYAMKSDFYTGPKDRQIIVMFTDAGALELKARKTCRSYPSDMVDMEGLQTVWACTSQEGCALRSRLKRMVLFAPADTVYEKELTKWGKVIFVPVDRSEGFEDVPFDMVITEIVKSATSV